MFKKDILYREHKKPKFIFNYSPNNNMFKRPGKVVKMF